MRNHLDRGSLTVAVITFLLFVAALFTKGLTHDLFLEAGIFLVSVKIIMMAYQNNVAIQRLDEKLEMILAEIASNAEHDAKSRDSSPEENRASAPGAS
jgi:hypothetical protein